MEMVLIDYIISKDIYEVFSNKKIPQKEIDKIPTKSLIYFKILIIKHLFNCNDTQIMNFLYPSF